MTHDATGHFVVRPRSYLGIFGALMVLTALTVWIAYYDLGALNVVAALAVAVTKASLVVLFFMHVRYSSRLTQLIVITGFVFFAIFITLTFADYLTRAWDLRLSTF